MKYEYLFDDAVGFATCHASTVAGHGTGGLVAAWFGGINEGAPDVAIWLSRRTGDGWTEPIVVADVADVPCWNPVVHLTATGELLLFYKVGSHPQTWSGFVSRSRDGGLSWSAGELLPAGILGPIKNKPLERSDGALVCGTSVESYRNWGCWVEITPDAGHTWSKHGPINVAGRAAGSIQPAIFGDGDHLVMLCRTRGLGAVVRGDSYDGGRTWSDLEAIELPHNNSGLDAVRLADGRVVLVYNHTTSGRTPLNLAVSEDLGLTWRPSVVLEDEPGEFSYPAIIEAHDGAAIVATYTWHRRRIRSVTVPVSEL